jgi:DNA-binding response OmpR family regulator
MSGKIIVIENDTDISELITLFLQEENYLMFQSKGDAIFQDILRIKPDLIIIDYFLKRGMTGAELCLTIKSSSLFEHIPIILMSSLVDLEYTAKECKATSLVYKPFNIHDLHSRIKEALLGIETP